MAVDSRRSRVEKDHPALSISRQCALLGVNRSSLYYKVKAVAPDADKPVMDAMDRIMTEFPYYGSRKVTASLRNQGVRIGRSRVRRLLQRMGLRATQPRKWKGGKRPEHPIYPYLLENLVVTGPNQVWCTDITYIPTRYGWVYLVAILDLYSRMILGWRLSATLEAAPCVQLLKETVARYGPPDILNQDRGSQYTSKEWLETALGYGIRLSMAGKGHCYHNIHMERCWRSVKQEEVYITEYVTLADARQGIGRYIHQYNQARLHQALGNKTPAGVYHAGSGWSRPNPGNPRYPGAVFCV